MNFLEAFDELSHLNEEVLTEKHWVAIRPKYTPVQKEAKKPEYYYRFLTVDDINKRGADIITMLSKHNGTYKQILDHEAFDELVQTLKEINPNDYTNPKNYEVLDPIPEHIKADKKIVKTLTKADRFLRQVAQTKLIDIKAENNNELKVLLGNHKCLIHHINAHEEDTTKENIVLVPYESGDKNTLKVAHGIHSVLHVTANSHDIKTEQVKWPTPLYWFDKNSGKWLVGSCTMIIELSEAPEGYVQPKPNQTKQTSKEDL